jgi:TonB family protein
MRQATAIAFFIIIAGCISGWAQGEVTSAPVVWERYKFSNTMVSILMPKMPVAVYRDDLCSQYIKNSYLAYAENAVYELSVIEKSYAEFPKSCITKVKFGKTTLNARLLELRSDPQKRTESSDKRHGDNVTKFTADNAVRWIVEDLDEQRWIEVGIIKRSDSPADENKFFDSLDIAIDLATTQGKQASLGSDRTLGDLDIKRPAPPTAPLTEPLLIVMTPKASYTDEARKNNIQGTVRVRVTLLANGGVGAVEVVHGLESGLTEQAVAAAKKIVFLPKRVNGANTSTTRLLEYGFRIH